MPVIIEEETSSLPAFVAPSCSQSSSALPPIDKTKLSPSQLSAIHTIIQRLVFQEMGMFAKKLEMDTCEQKRHEYPVINHFKFMTVIPDRPRQAIRDYIYNTEFAAFGKSSPDVSCDDSSSDPSLQEALKALEGDEKSKSKKAKGTNRKKAQASQVPQKRQQPEQQNPSCSSEIAHIPPKIKKTRKEEEREKLALNLANRMAAAGQLSKTLLEADVMAKNFEEYLRSCRKQKKWNQIKSNFF